MSVFDTYKTRVDISITNKEDPYSIPPQVVGEKLKDLTDLVSDGDSTLQTNLDNKVDKVSGKSLIFDTEISRLAGVSNLFDGTYISLSALQTAHPTSISGHIAIVDSGIGTNALIYIWDVQDGWVSGGGTGASNFADLGGSPSDNTALASALNGKEPSITAGSTSQYLRGDKSLATFTTSVLASVLTGLSFASSIVISSTDTLLQAFGKLQAQITALFKIPTGGVLGQVLSKIDGTDGNITWTDPGIPQLTPSTTGTALIFTADKVYGSKTTPETGNITVDITGAKLGVTVLVIHNSMSLPTLDSKFKKLSGSGSYVTGQINYIFCEYIASDEIIYSINQRS